MMVRFSFAAALALLTIGAAPAPRVYDLKLTVARNGATLATPRLLVRGAEQARFATQDAAGAGWTVTMTPTLGAQPGTASVAVAIEVAGRNVAKVGRRDTSERFRQRMTTTVMLKDPGTSRFDVLPRARAPGLHVDLALASRPA